MKGEEYIQSIYTTMSVYAYANAYANAYAYAYANAIAISGVNNPHPRDALIEFDVAPFAFSPL